MMCDPCTTGDHCGRPGEYTPRCTCQHHPPGTGQDAARLAAVAHERATPVSLVQEESAHAPQGRTADPDLYVSPGFNRVVQDVATVELLADWMKAVRSGQQAKAAVLHGALADRLGRLK